MFILAIIAAVLLLWYGFSPWLTYIFTGGAKTEKYNFGHAAAIFAGVWAASYVQAGVAKVPLLGGMLRTLVGLGVFAVLFVGIPLCIFACRSIAKGAITRQERAQREAQERVERDANSKREQMLASGPVVKIGQATGYFAQLGHKAAAAVNEWLWMGMRDLAQGIIVFGLPGTGKTFLIVLPFIRWMARDRGVGGFVPCVKTDFADDVTAAVAAVRGSADDVLRISPDGGLRWNLMDGMSPDTVAGFIRSVSERRGSGGDGTKWTDAAVSTTQTNALLLDALTNGGKVPFTVEGEDGSSMTYRWEFVSLHRVCNLVPTAWAKFRAAAQEYGKDLAAKDDHQRAEQIALSIEFRDTEFESLAADTRNSILFNINSVLGPLVKNLSIRRAFATETDVIVSDLDRGKWFVIDIDKDKYAGSYMFLMLLAFEQFQGYALRRMSKAGNKVAFVADEWHAFCTARQGDLFALSRAAGILPCLATQSLSKIIDGMGSKEKAHGALGTLASKIFLPSDDPATIEYAKQIGDQTDRSYTTTSTQRGESSNYTPGQYGGSQGDSWSETTSTNIQQRHLVTGQTFRELKSDFSPSNGNRPWAHGIAFLRVQGQTMDDVIFLYPADESIAPLAPAGAATDLDSAMPSF